MKRAQTVAKQGFPLRTMMMMIPIVAALSNPSLITQTADMAQTAMQTTASAFAPDIAGYATSAMQSVASTGTYQSAASPVFISGGPIYLPQS